MKCIDCPNHSLMPTVTLEGPLVCEMMCWEVSSARLITTGQQPKLKMFDAPEWCPLTCKREQVNPAP